YDWNQIKTITDNAIGNSNRLLAYSELIAKFEKYRQIFNIVLLYVVRPFLTPLLYLQAWQKNVLRNIFSKYYFVNLNVNNLQLTSRIKIFFFQLIDLVLYTNKNIFKHHKTGQFIVKDNEVLLYFIICNCYNTKLKKFLVNFKKRTELITIFENVLQTIKNVVAGKDKNKLSGFIETLQKTLEHLLEVKNTKFEYNAFDFLPNNIDKNETVGAQNPDSSIFINLSETLIDYLCHLYMLFYTGNKNIDILLDKKINSKKSKEIERQTLTYN
ncbi:hypothetical protein COBT_002796, partial [Conglomerata obtusa]